MCGIIGILSNKPVASRLIEGLKRLEYRGYDSAGIATFEDGELKRRRAEGKLVELEKVVDVDPLHGHIGIGHTRWATHGEPVTRNAHPHMTDKVAVVHNGIIENFSEIRAELEGKGFEFGTDTDTEVIPFLITDYVNAGNAPLDAVRLAVKRLHGAYALGIIFHGEESLMIAARQGSPLAIGYGMGDDEGEMYLGSDAIALAALTSDVTYLQEGDLAVLTPSNVVFEDLDGKAVERERVHSNISTLSIGKENYRHFMLKEIYEQPSVMGDVLHAYINAVKGEVNLPPLPFDLASIERMTLVACGTSYYAGQVSRYWAERLANVFVDMDFASEFRYRECMPDVSKGGTPQVAVFISQSGETADTLAAMRYAKAQGHHTVAIVNVTESTMAREADVVLPIYCGPEIGVASTKAYTSQLAVLACFVINIGKAKGLIDAEQEAYYAQALSEVPSRMQDVLNHDDAIKELAHDLALAKDILYIGRGSSYGLAREGALKLKEISYIHAEAIAAGELKHGTIALIDEDVPVVAIAPSDYLFEKTASNVQEVAARGGKVVLLSDQKGIDSLKKVTWASIAMPEADPFVTPILYAIPAQLIAYHVAVVKGTDVDQPRNLAKSVTVE